MKHDYTIYETTSSQSGKLAELAQKLRTLLPNTNMEFHHDPYSGGFNSFNNVPRPERSSLRIDLIEDDVNMIKLCLSEFWEFEWVKTHVSRFRP